MDLIGTVHCDIEGTRRLEYLLSRLKPKQITVEWPVNKSLDEIEEEILLGREKKVEAVGSLTDVPDVVKRFFVEFFSNSGYDTLVPIQYARANDLDIFPIDHPQVMPVAQGDSEDYSGFVIGLRNGLGELPQGIERISYNEFRRLFSKEFDRAYFDPSIIHEIGKYISERNVQNTGELVHLNDPRFEEQREQFMTDQILRVRPDVHIAGIAHVVDGYFERDSFQPLYRRLGEVVSDRIRLCEAIKSRA